MFSDNISLKFCDPKLPPNITGDLFKFGIGVTL